MVYRLVEHSEDADIDDPIQEHVGGALGTASSTSAAAGSSDDSAEKGIPGPFLPSRVKSFVNKAS